MNRHKRSDPTDYYIDIAAVIDYKLYSSYLIEAGYSPIQAVKNINEHYAFVFAGVDKIFQGISGVNFRIHIRLCKVYITQTISASYFIDKLTTGDSISTESALPALQKFVTGDGRGFVGDYDHVMFFTG
ncbi:hypothetical protein Btru_066831 [Bulinus truncatus]|nr:hypothetical protein Btru_066831 [Bulinus truncatus]